jgi:hypothetical protein
MASGEVVERIVRRDVGATIAQNAQYTEDDEADRNPGLRKRTVRVSRRA